MSIHGRSKVNQSVESAEQLAAKHRETLDRIRNGLATKVRILASPDSCPTCEAMEGAYTFEDVPELPLVGCSHPRGCQCKYEPVLDRFGP